MSDASAQLVRLQKIIGVVLAALAIVCVIVAVADVWPASAFADWLGTDSLRVRVAGAFAVFGGALLAILLVAVAIKAIATRRSG